MTLEAMLSAHDDNALEALASKGLVRRARRDFEAGLASVKQRSKTEALVIADGQSVTLDKSGPKNAKCDCPADGVCRHILIAVIALREAAPAAAPPEQADAPAQEAPAQEAPAQPEAPTQSAIADIAGMTQPQLEKFAGADWPAAIALAESAKDVKFTTSGSSCTVDLEAGAASVTFIAGDIKNAAFKGPKTQKRKLVAAAAILLRTREGVKLEKSETGIAEADEKISAAFLDETAEALSRAVRMTLSGAPLVAADLLFDLGISARVKSVPRLTSHLRILARQARLADRRDISFEPEIFLAEAARARALIEALKTASEDPILTGSLRRDYKPGPAADLWFLGASKWRSESGARGLTLYAFDAANKRWLSGTFARAAGQDPTFEPAAAYRSPVWAADAPVKLMGGLWHLAEPLLSDDGAIAPTLPKRPVKRQATNPGAALHEAGAVIEEWIELRRSLSQRFGSGLRRRTTALPALISPTRFGEFEFDELGQTIELEVYDRSGDMLHLSLNPDSTDLAKRLRTEGMRHGMMLIEAVCTVERPMYRAIALIAEKPEGLEVINLDLDQWPRAKTVMSAIGLPSITLPIVGAKDRVLAPRMAHDPARDVAGQALTMSAAAISNMPLTSMPNLSRSADSLGLATLARSLDHLTTHPETPAALRTAYLASEIQASLIWS